MGQASGGQSPGEVKKDMAKGAPTGAAFAISAVGVAGPATQSGLSLVAYLAGVNFLDLTPKGSLFGQRLFAEFHPAFTSFLENLS
jgi:hypothetical protein